MARTQLQVEAEYEERTICGHCVIKMAKTESTPKLPGTGKCFPCTPVVLCRRCANMTGRWIDEDTSYFRCSLHSGDVRTDECSDFVERTK